LTNLKYILLDNGIAVPCPSLKAWCDWYETHDRVIRQEVIGRSMVSTVFLGLDHNFYDDGPPILFETMIFGGPRDQSGWQYATQADALEGHNKAVELVTGPPLNA
jgi:hypothetical protein